jgi:hypothetical protein
MLSVFITPWTKPTRIQCATISALRTAIWGEPVAQQRFATALQLGEIARDAGFSHLLQQRLLAAQCGQLEAAEAQERRCHAAHDGAGFDLGMTVVEHVAQHALAAADQRQRARGRHAQMVHCLAAQEFANRRTQHRAPIGAT